MHIVLHNIIDHLTQVDYQSDNKVTEEGGVSQFVHHQNPLIEKTLTRHTLFACVGGGGGYGRSVPGGVIILLFILSFPRQVGL